jgi:hypothetical protein
MSTTITIHRALSLIKKIKQELSTTFSGVSNPLFIATLEGSNNKPTKSEFKTEEELRARLQSDTDSVFSSLALLSKLQVAIATSNLQTKVMFGNEEVSITHLLAIKQTLDLRREFLLILQKQMSTAQHIVNRASEQIEANLRTVADAQQKELILTSLTSLYGASVITSSKNKTPAVLLKEVSDEINYLTHEVDTILSEMNVTTSITY